MIKSSAKLFDSSFSIDDCSINIDKTWGMCISDISRMREYFNRFGFLLLNCSNLEHRANLLSLVPFFGRVVPHARADAHGVLSVEASAPKAGYIDSTSERHPPHTDGAFADNPERVAVLQCVVPARSGGTSFLGSGKLAYDKLPEHHRSTLFDAEAMSITRNDRKATKPIFRENGKRVEMSFRTPDGAAEVVIKSNAQTAYDELRKGFERDLLRFNMSSGQILIFDNTAVVHGRERFDPDGDRRYSRLNLDGNGLIEFDFGFPI